MGFFQDLVGKKPVVPTLPEVSLADEQKKATAANIAIAPEAQKLAQLSQDQIRKMMEQAIPGFDSITGKVSGNIQSLLKGEIPLDVSQAVQRSDAGRSLAGGYGGTDMARNLVARDLGLTSLDITQKGLSSAESWIREMEQLYSPSEAIFTGMFTTPQQMFAADVEERNMQFQRNWLENQIQAMPAPWAEDMKQFVYRAMSAYSGTAVKANPYSTPGSFGPGPGSGGRDTSGIGIMWGAQDWQSSGNDPTTDTPYDWSGSGVPGNNPASATTDNPYNWGQ
jgi:hypothetical protein